MPNYKRNFIKRVIFRVDFEKEFDKFKDDIPDELKSQLSNELINKEIRIIKEERIIESSPRSISSITVENKEINFISEDKSKRIAMSKTFFYSEFTKYSSFKNFFLVVSPIISYLKDQQRDFPVKRIGLRFTDDINLKEKNIFNWDKYLNKKLVSNLNWFNNKIQYMRTLNILEFIYKGSNVVFQYGMINPDYPSPIKKKIFLLDIDTVRKGQLKIDDIDDIAKELHKIQIQLFNSSITKVMKNYLNADRKI